MVYNKNRFNTIKGFAYSIEEIGEGERERERVRASERGTNEKVSTYKQLAIKSNECMWNMQRSHYITLQTNNKKKVEKKKAASVDLIIVY